MAYLGNSPSKETILRLEARKSFSFHLAVMDPERRPISLTGATLRIVMKQSPMDAADTDDGDNLIAADTAVLVDAARGLARFDIQASDLNLPTGEYQFAVVLKAASGYSTVLVKGLVDLQQNTEFTSVASAFSTAQPAQQLEVLLRGSTTVEVTVGTSRLPAAPSFSYSTAAPTGGVDGDVHAQYFLNGSPARLWVRVSGTWR